MFKLSGKVYAVMPTQTFGDRGFKKRTVVVLDESGQYTQHLPFDCVRDDVNILDSVEVDDVVEVEFKPTGREWRRSAADEPRYFAGFEVISINNLSKMDEPDTEPEVPEDEEVPF